MKRRKPRQKLTTDRILALRQAVNDSEYIDNAIYQLADKMAKKIEGNGRVEK